MKYTIQIFSIDNANRFREFDDCIVSNLSDVHRILKYAISVYLDYGESRPRILEFHHPTATDCIVTIG